MAFKYRGGNRTVESITRRARATGAYDSYLDSDVPMFKPKEGENCIRILPLTWEDTEKWGDDWAIDIFVHYSVGPDNGTYLCLDKMKGEACPVCEARRETTEDEESKKLRPSQRRLAWIIDRNEESKGPQPWPMPIKKIAGDIQLRSKDKKTNTPLLVDDPEEGYDVIFTREGTTETTDYRGV
jgi:hypothetical protein